jgi:shikimate kinase
MAELNSATKLPERVRRIVLIGLMGAGKTTVGRILADRLGWSFLDLDERIESQNGRTVAEIFAQDGEKEFRRLERQLTAELASAEHIVLAPGGGWALYGKNTTAISADTAFFWLQVSPEEAVNRLGMAPESRPLLAGPDPLERARALNDARSARYAELGWPITTEARAPAEIAQEIMSIVGSRVHTHEPATNWKNG